MNDEMRQLGEEYWEYQLEVYPTMALILGDHRYDEQMEDTSREAEDANVGRLPRVCCEGRGHRPGRAERRRPKSPATS